MMLVSMNDCCLLQCKVLTREDDVDAKPSQTCVEKELQNKKLSVVSSVLISPHLTSPHLTYLYPPSTSFHFADRK